MDFLHGSNTSDPGKKVNARDAKSPNKNFKTRRAFNLESQGLNKESETNNFNFNEKDEVKKQIAIRKLIKITNEKLNNLDKKIKRDYKTKVNLFAVFLRVSEIENIKQKFQAEFQLEASWEDNGVVGDTFDPTKNWIPSLFIENAIGAVKQDIKYKIKREYGRTLIFEQRNVKGTFYETLELYDFPLDIQDVSITVTASRSVNEIEFELSTYDTSRCVVENFRAKQEWKISSQIETNQREFTDLFKRYKRPGLNFSGKIARRAGYYLNNAYLLMSLGLMPFSFSVTSPNTRIGSTVMLILSSINFKIAVTTRLPTVSYLTVLDKYAITALIYLAVLCVYHSIIGSSLFSNAKNLIFIDRIFLAIFGGLFVLFHMAYIPYFVFKLSKHKSIEKEVEKENPSEGKPRTVSSNSIIPLIEEDELNKSSIDISLTNNSTKLMITPRFTEFQRSSMTSQTNIIVNREKN